MIFHSDGLVAQRYFPCSVVCGRVTFFFSPNEFSEGIIREAVDKLNTLHSGLYRHVPPNSLVLIALVNKAIQTQFVIRNFHTFEFVNRKNEQIIRPLEKISKFILNNLPVYPANLEGEDINFDTITNGFNRKIIENIVEIRFPSFAYMNSKSFAEGIEYLKEDLKTQIKHNPSLKRRIHSKLSIAIFDRVDRDDPFRFLIKWTFCTKGIPYSVIEPENALGYGTCKKLYDYIKYYFPEIISNSALFELDHHTRIFPTTHWHNIEIRFDANAFKRDEVEKAIHHLEQKYPDLGKKLPHDCLTILEKGDSKHVIVVLPYINQIFQFSDQDLYSSGEKTLFQSVNAKDLLVKIMSYLDDNIDGIKQRP